MVLEKAMAPHSSTLPGKSHGWRSLVGCSPWGCEESDTTEQLHFHFSLSCIGEGNGNPLQCSCLENPRDGGACWAAVYGVTQSWTRLKWLSSSSSKRWSRWWNDTSLIYVWRPRTEGGNRTGSILKAGLHLGLDCGLWAICPVSMETTYQLENQIPRMEEPQGSYLDSPLPKRIP